MIEQQAPKNAEQEQRDAMVLLRLRLFRNVDLTNPDVSRLLSQCHYRQLGKDEVLLSTDVINNYLFVLISGRLVIQLDPEDEGPLTMVC